MDIIIFAATDFPAGPATTSRIKMISKILKEAGNNVTVAIFHANTKNMIPDNIQIEGNYDNINFCYLNGKTVRPSSFTKAVFDSFRGLVNALRYLRSKKKQGCVDAVIFYTPNFFLSFPSILMARFYRVAIIIELCEIYSSSPRESLKSRIFSIISFAADIILPWMCSGIIVISTKIKEFVEDRTADKELFHLPILVEFDRFVNSSDSFVPILLNKQYFINSGALGEKEGIEYILNAFALLGTKYEDIYLVLTGDPDIERKKYTVELSKKLGILHRIIFTGYLSEKQLVWAYHNALALLCCRCNSKYANYGFPTKLAEYLSTGKPVIVTDVGDINIYLKNQETAFIAKPDDAESILVQMDKVISFPEIAIKVGLNGRKIARDKFDYKKYVSSLDSFIKTVKENNRLK